MFVLRNKRRVLDLVAELYTHPSGCNWVHINANDPNNVFNVAFRTESLDSTGIAHILEHVALCGSSHYPVRDPFFKMLNRSAATFMNAMTWDDQTMYPFSSQNSTDFYNLLNVYLDSCFSPLLTEFDFLQEGWRLEHKGQNTSPVIFKGVVYNEMKGALADVNSLYQTRLQQALFQGTPYGFNSGGEPPEIPTLTHARLVEFHRERYHPSNANFYSYGSFPVRRHMDVVETVINKIAPLSSTLPPLSNIHRWMNPKTASVNGPLDPLASPDNQCKLSVAYLANQSSDSFEAFVAQILTKLLISGASSPMYKALIQSKLGAEYAPGTGFNPYTSHNTISFGLSGISKANCPKIEQAILDTLESCAKVGFSASRIDSTFHLVELALKSRTKMFGMNLGYSVLKTMLHNGDPLEAIDLPAVTLFNQAVSQC